MKHINVKVHTHYHDKCTRKDKYIFNVLNMDTLICSMHNSAIINLKHIPIHVVSFVFSYKIVNACVIKI